MNLYFPYPSPLTPTDEYAMERAYILDSSSKRLFSSTRRRYNFTISTPPPLSLTDQVYLGLHSQAGLDTNLCVGCLQDDTTLRWGINNLAHDKRSAIIIGRVNSTIVRSQILTQGFAPYSLDQLSRLTLTNIPGKLSSWTPVGANCRTYQVNHTRSHAGEWLGATSYDLGEKSTIKLVDIPARWMEENWETLSDQLCTQPFYLENSSSNTSRQYLAYCWLDGDLEQPAYTSSDRCNFTFKVVG